MQNVILKISPLLHYDIINIRMKQNNHGRYLAMDKQTEGLIQDVKILNQAGFRLADKAKFESIIAPMLEFEIVDADTSNLEPDIALVRKGLDSGGSGLGAGEFNAMVFMHSDATRSATMSFALDKSTDQEKIDALDDLGSFVFALPDGSNIVHMSMCQKGSTPGDSQEQQFEDCLMKLQTLDLKTIKYPLNNTALSMLPMFSGPDKRPANLSDSQIADLIVDKLGVNADVFDDPEREIEQAIEMKYGNAPLNQPYSINQSPRPGLRQ